MGYKFESLADLREVVVEINFKYDDLKIDICKTYEYDSDADLSLLSQPSEIELIRHIAELPDTVNASARTYDPARITKYAIELATLFHRFYDSCSVKNAETNELRLARLALCISVKQVLENALSILNITAPEKM